MLPWRTREEFIKLIWEGLDGRGISFDAMRMNLLDYAEANDLRVSQQMIQKLLYTLNFARCFNYSKNATSGYRISIPDDLYTPVYTVVDAEGAIDKLHERYLRMLAEDAAILDPDAAFDLLYGDEVADEREREDRRAALAEICARIKPLGQIGQAYVDASRRANSSPQGSMP